MTHLPPSRSEHGKHSNVLLPAYLTSFIGQDRTLNDVRSLIVRPDVRLLTLVGPGGAGKTRIAVESASASIDEFDQVLFVDFTSLTDASLAISEIAQALGLVEESSLPLFVRLANAIGNRKLLLVLDNLERILECGPTLTALLRSCGGLTILATSREPLHVAGEQEYPIPPLELADAIELFVARANTVRPSIAAIPESELTIAAVCRELDSLPLAIELAAARAKVLSPEAILSRLEFRLSLLTGGPLDSPGRQRTMRDAIAWSYDLLDAVDQRNVRRLAVFSGGFTLSAAAFVLDDEIHSSGEPLDSISSLVDKNLVRPLGSLNSEQGPERFGMLETIHEFALEQLAASGELAACRDRHALWCLAFAEQAAPKLAGGESTSWAHQIGENLPNLRAALKWWIEHQRTDNALRLASALWPYWTIYGRFGEGRSWLDLALALPSGDASLRAQAVGIAGHFASNQGDYAFASQVEDALATSRLLGDDVAESIALFALADIACEQNDYHRAVDLLKMAFTSCDRLGDGPRATMALVNLGSLLRRMGDDDQATVLIAQSIERARAQQFGLALTFGLNLMSRIARAQGDIESARAMYQESLEIAWRMQHRISIAFIFLDGAALAIAADQPERAARLLGAAEMLREVIGLPRIPSASHALGSGYQSTLDQTEAALGEIRFAEAWNAGRTMTLEQAIEEASWEIGTAVPSDTPAPFGLTAREQEVLGLLVAGQTDRQIGDTLFISPRTAQVHVANILSKLNVPTRGAAAATALRLQIVTDPSGSESRPPTANSDPLRT